MRELILILIYLTCSFATVLIIRIMKKEGSARFFWSAWLSCLVGAFLGGVFGSKIFLGIAWEIGLLGEIIPALLGSWLLVGIFLLLRKMPEQW